MVCLFFFYILIRLDLFLLHITWVYQLNIFYVTLFVFLELLLSFFSIRSYNHTVGHITKILSRVLMELEQRMNEEFGPFYSLLRVTLYQPLQQIDALRRYFISFGDSKVRPGLFHYLHLQFVVIFYFKWNLSKEKLIKTDTDTPKISFTRVITILIYYLRSHGDWSS